MTGSESSASAPGEKLLGAPAMKVRIALASGLVLALGAWLAPPAAPTGLTTPQERPAPLLEEQVQLRETVRPFAGIQDAVARLPLGVVTIPAMTAPVAVEADFSAVGQVSEARGFGAFVSDRYVLTHAAALQGRSSVTLPIADGRILMARVIAYEPPSGLVLMETDAPHPTAALIATMPPQTGALAVAAGPREHQSVAVPVFVTSVDGDRYTIGALDESVLPGMPVYTLDGQLLAVAGGNDRGYVYAVRAAVDRLLALAAAGVRQASFGLAFHDLGGMLTRVFGRTGIVVSDVIPNGPADLAGLQPGDVVVAIDDVEVHSADDAARTLSAIDVDTVTTVRVRRAGRVRSLEVAPAPSYEVDTLAAAAAAADASFPEARLLFAPAALDAAAIPPTARVIAVNGRALATRADVRRELLRSASVVPVLLRQGNRRFFAAVESGR